MPGKREKYIFKIVDEENKPAAVSFGYAAMEGGQNDSLRGSFSGTAG